MTKVTRVEYYKKRVPIEVVSLMLAQEFSTYFWERVDKRGDDECWLWTGSLDRDGYGRCWWQGQKYFAHRVAFLLQNAHLDDKLVMMHLCDTRRCCNARHLKQGTILENHQDMVAKGRHSYGNNNGKAVVTPDDVRAIRAAWATGLHTYAEIAATWGISKGAVGHILNLRSWKHVV